MGRRTHTTDIPVWDTDTDSATGTVKGPLTPRPEWHPCTGLDMPPSLQEPGTPGTTVFGLPDTEPVSATDTEFTPTVWAVTMAGLIPMAKGQLIPRLTTVGLDTPDTEVSDTGTAAPTPELTLDKLNHQ